MTLAAGAAVGAATGGEAGAIAAVNEVENNYLKHKEILAADKALADCAKKGGDVDACKKNIVAQMQEIDAARDRDVGEASRNAQIAEYQIKYGCQDQACVSRYQMLQTASVNYLSTVAAGVKDGSISLDGYNRGWGIQLGITADGAMGRAGAMYNGVLQSAQNGYTYLTSNGPSTWARDAAVGVQAGAGAAYSFGQAALTEPMPALAIDRAIDKLAFRTSYNTGELVFDAALGVVTSVGSKAATWVVGKGWTPLPKGTPTTGSATPEVPPSALADKAPSPNSSVPAWSANGSGPYSPKQSIIINAEAGPRITANDVLPKTATADLAGTGITWGAGIKGQGLPWEDYLADAMPAGSRLPPNFKTFDFFDPQTGMAVSAKTLDTSTVAKLQNPAQVYSALKGNIDAAADFSGYKRSGVNLDSKMIAGRELQVAIPASTTVAQWAQINKAIEYGKSNGVSVKITVVKP